jgi:nucleoside-diphosphate-sugar epimerase
MKITITGISGFVGQNLSTYLFGKGYQIHDLSLRTNTWKKDFVSDVDAIIHLAGKAHDTSNTCAHTEYFRVNRDFTIDIFEQFLKSEVKDFFYFSSVKAVADTVDSILTEDINLTH